jgi:uracil-DNA glycosylase
MPVKAPKGEMIIRVTDGQGVYVMPIFHPAYLLRNRDEQPHTQEHLNRVKMLLDAMR